MTATAPLLSAEQASDQGKQWAEVQASDSWLFWLEFDASLGRNLLLGKQGQQPTRCLTPEGYSVRSRVHEYGGGSYCIAGPDLLFVNESDQGLYRQNIANPDDLSQVFVAEGYRFGDLQFDPQRNRIIAIEEQHRTDQITNRIVAIELGRPVTGVELGGRKVLVQGDDFYASPRLNQQNDQLAWISWSNPHQPWTSTCLWLGKMDQQGVPQGQRQVTRGEYRGQDESVVQPEFGPDGSLYFLSDRSGWWNLYRYLDTKKSNGEGYTEALLSREAEFCRAPWQLGQRAYVVLDENRIGCSWWRQGRACIGELQLASRQLCSWGEWPAVHSLAQQGGALFAIAEPASEPGQLRRWSFTGDGAQRDPAQQGQLLEQLDCEVSSLSPQQVILPCHITIPSRSEQSIYGLLYRPLVTPAQTSTAKPALIIQLHGGPTAQADGRFDPLKQFWLQRGFVMLDLNYRGSSGYGRDYRHSLKGQWGVHDVEDVLDAAQYCIDQGWVDPERIVVRGNSAGGYTVLQVLSQRAGQKLIRTGASLYGISDLERLAQETHKFESHYLDWLVGDPNKARMAFRLRSPIHRPQDFCRPLIFFQGGLDRVVPATQTYRLYNQLKGLGLEVEYHAFPNERHGFRQAKNRALVLQRELMFYSEQLGLALQPDASINRTTTTTTETDYVQRTG